MTLDAEPEALRLAVGLAIRKARAEAGMSMRALALACGVSQPFLSAVERGLSTPSLFTLYRIAEVLNTTPSALLPVHDPDDITVVRSGDGRRVPSSDRANSAIGRVVFSDPERHLEIYEYVIDPDDDLDVWFEHPGDTVLHLIDGTLRVEFATRPDVVLQPGDCMVHPGKIAHRWAVEGDGGVRLFLVVVRPEPGSMIELPTLAFGTAPLASIFWGNEEARAVAAVRRAVDAGLRMFDTAPLYGMGEAETRLGEVLSETEADVVVATKVGRTDTFDYSRDAVLRSLATSRQRLRRDYIDIVHIHDPDDHLEAALDHALPALVELRDAGAIGAVSLGTMSVSTAQHFLQHADLDALMLAGRLSLLDQSGRAVAAQCADRGIPFIAAAIFNSGVLARPEQGAWFDYAPADEEMMRRVRHLARICANHGTSLRTAALHYPSRVPGVTTTVVGMASAAEVDDNLAAWQSPPPDSLWDELAI